MGVGIIAGLSVSGVLLVSARQRIVGTIVLLGAMAFTIAWAAGAFGGTRPSSSRVAGPPASSHATIRGGRAQWSSQPLPKDNRMKRVALCGCGGGGGGGGGRAIIQREVTAAGDGADDIRELLGPAARTEGMMDLPLKDAHVRCAADGSTLKVYDEFRDRYEPRVFDVQNCGALETAIAEHRGNGVLRAFQISETPSVRPRQ